MKIAKFLRVKVVVALLVPALAVLELKTSWLQAHVLAAIDRRMAFAVAPGPSPFVPYPHSGPYDIRLGYERLPAFLERLARAGHQIRAQARTESAVARLVDRLAFPVYREKTQAGLALLDRAGRPLFLARYPRRMYADFEAIPPVVVRTLLFIENREILDEGHPHLNPAVEWDRFAKAVLGLGYRLVEPAHAVAGASTLATQLEKMRHSPGGRTAGAAEKLRQMASASLRAYLDGAETIDARKRIVRDYVNSMPLAALPGYGDVSGLADGLSAWFGADPDAVDRALRDPGPARDPALLDAQARAYRQVLSLLLAIRQPSTLLGGDRAALSARVDAYLRLLANAGIIAPALRDAALRVSLDYRGAPPETAPVSFGERKAADAIRVELLSLLGPGSAYDLDRLDLTVLTTIDRDTQQDVARMLRRLGDPDFDSVAGLRGKWLLGGADPAAIVYSFSLYERGAGANRLRIQADNYDQPLDINGGTKLELGSTAKLRTMIHYLEIVAELHDRYAGGRAPGALPPVPSDPLSRWAAEYLSKAPDAGLPAMLEAALARRYSASPGESFATGGGVHRFANFDREDNGRIMTVREAFRRSVNLVFIRLMRDIVSYHIARLPGVPPALLEDPADPGRPAYLARFADSEGRLYLRRFYEASRGRSPDEMLEALVRGLRHRSAKRLAVIFRSVCPEADAEQFAAFLRADPAGAALSDRTIARLYEEFAPGNFNLSDRGTLAGVHPLQLWLIEYRTRHPEAKLAEILAASAEERQEVYRWLFTTRTKRAQDNRIRTILEVDAFRDIHRAWKRLGFPFDSLVPSYASAIGSSGDNPAALAELMGILVNDGVRYPTVRIRRLDFGEGTPLETVVEPRPAAGERVLSPVLAGVARRELVGVVTEGTAKRVSGAIALSDGTPLEIGGKTGTGDNRYQLFARGGRPAGSRVVNRTATFVFMIGDRFYGTVTAFVPGRQAASYGFTSALPVQVLKLLAPALMPILSASP